MNAWEEVKLIVIGLISPLRREVARLTEPLDERIVEVDAVHRGIPGLIHLLDHAKRFQIILVVVPTVSGDRGSIADCARIELFAPNSNQRR